MANNSMSGYQGPTVIDARGRIGGMRSPGPPLQPPDGGGGDGMEARVRVLETHVEYIKSGIAKLETSADAARSDLSSIRIELAAMTANVAHLPSKTLLVTASVSTVTLIVLILTVLSHFGWLVAGK